MLYNDQKLPEIHVDFSVQNETESEVSNLPVEQCQEGVQVSAVQVLKEEKVYKRKESQIDRKVEELVKESKIPDALCAAEAVNFTSEEVDFRPHLFDPQLKRRYSPGWWV